MRDSFVTDDADAINARLRQLAAERAMVIAARCDCPETVLSDGRTRKTHEPNCPHWQALCPFGLW